MWLRCSTGAGQWFVLLARLDSGDIMVGRIGLTSLELCAGAGGQALGLEAAGFQHQALVEIDNACCETLRKNRPLWQVVEGDLRKFKAKAYEGIDLLAGGLPCPPFSVAGKQLGALDERNLFPAALRIIEQVKPRAVEALQVGVHDWLAPAQCVGLRRAATPATSSDCRSAKGHLRSLRLAAGCRSQSANRRRDSLQVDGCEGLARRRCMAGASERDRTNDRRRLKEAWRAGFRSDASEAQEPPEKDAG